MGKNIIHLVGALTEYSRLTWINENINIPHENGSNFLKNGPLTPRFRPEIAKTRTNTDFRQVRIRIRTGGQNTD